jgi:hypothetical protein
MRSPAAVNTETLQVSEVLHSGCDVEKCAARDTAISVAMMNQL